MKKKQSVCTILLCACLMLIVIFDAKSNSEMTLQEKLYSNIESRGIHSSMAIELPDGEIIASGIKNDIAFLICLNEKAETVWRVEFKESTKSKIISFAIVQKSIFAIEEVKYEWPKESEFFLLQVQSDATYQREKIGSRMFTPQKIVAGKNIYMLLGTEKIEKNGDAYLLSTIEVYNIEKKMIWRKVLEEQNITIGGAKETDLKEYYVWGLEFFDEREPAGVVIKLNEFGELVWKTEILEANWPWIAVIAEGQNGDLHILGNQKKAVIENGKMQPFYKFYAHIDSNGNVIRKLILWPDDMGYDVNDPVYFSIY